MSDLLPYDLTLAKAVFQLRAIEAVVTSEPDCPDCGLPHPSRNPYCFCRRAVVAGGRFRRGGVMMIIAGGLTAILGGVLLLTCVIGGAEVVTGRPGQVAIGIASAGMLVLVAGLVMGL